MSVQEKALTVNFSISQWTARKYDKKVSKEVEEQHQAKDAGRYNKVLIASGALAKIQKVANDTRDFHYKNTMPWQDNGDRLLPSANYFTYIQRMQEFKHEFESEVHKFVQNYEAMIEDARVRLNSMFVQSDYPSKAEVRHRFAFKICSMPIPTVEDFRLDLNQTEVNTLKLQAENEINDRVTNAVKDLWQRLKEPLEKIHTKLTEERTGDDGEVKAPIFRDTLIDNLKEVLEVLPRLNFTNDPALEEIAKDCKALLVSPEELRKNENLREETAAEAEEILNKFSSFFAQ